MSDSKRDLTRIEDLSEYLHELNNEDENYLPDLPDESEPPSFMEETQITNDSFENSESTSFESDIQDFSSDSDNQFESTSTFGDDSQEDSFSSSFDSSGFEETEESESETEFGSSSFESNETDDPFESSFDDDSTEDVNEISQSDNFSSTDFDSLPETQSEYSLNSSIQEEKTPIHPQPVVTDNYKAPENFEDVKSFGENSSFTGMASEGNPSFSVLIKDIKYVEDAKDILTLLKELGLSMDNDEVLLKRLSRGEFIVPRISEFAATVLAHKLRRFDIDIQLGPSDEIHPSKYTQEPEIGLVSKLSLYQNQQHHFQFGDTALELSQIIICATPSLDGYQILKYISVASEHMILDGQIVEDENSLEVNTHYQELAHKLKAHALKNNANAIVGLNYQLTPLPSNYGTSHNRYRLTCTGNLVWINKV